MVQRVGSWLTYKCSSWKRFLLNITPPPSPWAADPAADGGHCSAPNGSGRAPISCRRVGRRVLCVGERRWKFDCLIITRGSVIFSRFSPNVADEDARAAGDDVHFRAGAVSIFFIFGRPISHHSEAHFHSLGTSSRRFVFGFIIKPPDDGQEKMSGNEAFRVDPFFSLK